MPISRPSPSRSPAGFTLVELVVVMIIIGVMSVVVLPRFDLFKGFDQVGYRDKVKATLEYARKAAVARRRYTCVSLSGNDMLVTADPGVPESYLGGCPASALPLPAEDRTCSPVTVGKVCAPSGVSLTGTATLTFSPLGKPSSAGAYTVTGDSAENITVEAESGYVH
jgi:MSHA pilin protein MshC